MTAKKKLRIALAGNPNAGKTTLFNAITGARQHVGNWPGVTVEKKEGLISFGGHEIAVVDLPGTYSLTAYSIEEVIARKYIVHEQPDVVIHVIDSGNLERNLYLTTQLLELDCNLVLALNMHDALQASGARIDAGKLALLLRTPAVFTVGHREKGIRELMQAVMNAAESRNGRNGRVEIPYGHEIESHLKVLTEKAGKVQIAGIQHPHRWVAVKTLENDGEVVRCLGQSGPEGAELLSEAEKTRSHLSSLFKEDPEIVLTERRYGFVAGVMKEVFSAPLLDRVSLSDRIDSVLTHRVLGLPAFFLMIWAMFQLTFTVGAYPMEWIDALVSWLGITVAAGVQNEMLRSLLVDGVIGGVGSVLVFIPNIFILFLFISFLEDSGYMARAAFLTDRVMHLLGLHGKAFIPMLMGFGCNAPAIMATRTLESERDRILTILINPLMSCSARLPVYVLITAAFFSPERAGTVIFSIYLLGLILAIAMGRLFSRTVLPGQAAPFVMELPPYRLPTAKGLLIHMWDRGKIFLRKMGGVILVGSVVIWALGAFPRDPVLQASDQSRTDPRCVELKGKIPNEADPQAAGIQLNAVGSHPPDLKGDSKRIFSKRVDITGAGSEDVSEEQIEQGTGAGKTPNVTQQMEASYIGRIGRFLEPVFRPLEFDGRIAVALLTGFVAKEIVVSTLGVLYQVGAVQNETSEGLAGALRNSGMTSLAAYAFMAFVLIYTPCLGTLAVIRRETNSWKWTFFSVGYSLVLAWVVAFVIVQAGRLLGLG